MHKLSKCFFLSVPVLLAVYCSQLTAVFAATVSVTVDCANKQGAVSPYIFGHNESGFYYKPLMTDPTILQEIRDAGISMIKFPPGSVGSYYDFKYNNYAGRYYDPPKFGGAGWVYGTPTITEELAFCKAVEAEPQITCNIAFIGPNGTETDWSQEVSYGGDYASYTGAILPDTPAHRAQTHGVDMVNYVRSVCDAHPEFGNWRNGTKYPIYYQMTNEWQWEMAYASYKACYPVYRSALKAQWPNLNIIVGRNSGGPGFGDELMVPDFGDQIDICNYYFYDSGATNPARYIYLPGEIDGKWMSINGDNQNFDGSLKALFDQYWPAHAPLRWDIGEWGDDFDSSGSSLDKFKGGLYTAHFLYRMVLNKFELGAAWDMWDPPDWQVPTGTFNGVLNNLPNPKYFGYKIWKNFGNTLVDCPDTAPEDDFLPIASLRTSDNNLTIMVLNISETEPYSATINVNNFNMSGNIDVCEMNSTNTYTGGPGPSTSTLTGKSSPISYTFPPYTATLLVIKGQPVTDTTPPSAPAQVRDGTGADVSVVSSTSELSANWDASTDPESAIAKYWYAIGMAAGATNVTNAWIDNGTNTSVTKTGLNLTAGRTYYFSVKAENSTGLQSAPANSNGQAVGGGALGAGETKVYPNPYTLGGQGIIFAVGSSAGAEVRIYTLSGKLVRKLSITAGTNTVTWDGRNEASQAVDRGVYIYRIAETGGNAVSGKLAVLK